MVYTTYVKLLILFYHFQALKPYIIARVLDEKGMKVSRFSVHKFIQHYNESGSIDRKDGSGRPSKVTLQVKCSDIGPLYQRKIPHTPQVHAGQ